MIPFGKTEASSIILCAAVRKQLVDTFLFKHSFSVLVLLTRYHGAFSPVPVRAGFVSSGNTEVEELDGTPVFQMELNGTFSH